MKLEKQVCSLELAKKLKELGVKQESIFYWTRSYTRKTGVFQADSKYYLAYSKNKKYYAEYECSAFTVAELGELLPPCYHSVKVCGGLEWQCLYIDFKGENFDQD